MYSYTPRTPILVPSKPRSDMELDWLVQDGGYVEVFRTDTVRRKTPVSLFDAQTSVYTQVQDVKKSYHARWLPDTVQTNGLQGVFLLDRSSLQSRATTVAENRLRSQAKGVSANLGQMVAEYKQTINMFAQFSQRAYGIYRHVKRKRFLWSRNVNSKKNSRDYLMYIYGVAPLTGDMADLCATLGTKKVPKLIVSSSHTLRDRRYEKFPVLGTFVMDDEFVEVRVKCKATVAWNENLFRDSTLVRYGLSNPLAIGWELVPFSFVVDWWINVGEVLLSLDNRLAFTGLTGFTSQRVDHISLRGDAVSRYKYTGRSSRNFPLTSSFQLKPTPSLRHVINGLALWRVMKRDS